MAEAASNERGSRLAVGFTIALLVLCAIVFAAAFVLASASRAIAPADLEENAYAGEFALALAGASATKGETLIEDFRCGVCHILGDKRVAPRFDGIGERASVEYLYESIARPGAVLVEGYANAMPSNFAERLSQEEIGHLIAYLLTQ